MYTLWNSPDFFQIIYDVIFFVLVIPSLVIGLVTIIWQQKLEAKKKKYKRIHRLTKISWTTGFVATILLWSIGKRIDAINSTQQDILRHKIKKTEALTDTLKTELTSTKSQLKKTRIQLDSVVTKTESARQQAEKASADASKIIESNKPRSLTEKQKKTLINALMQFKGEIGVFWQFGDTEAQNFANELMNIIGRSDWRISSSGGLALTDFFMPTRSGLYIDIGKLNTTPQYVLILKQTLEAVGFAVKIERIDLRLGSTISVFVASRNSER